MEPTFRDTQFTPTHFVRRHEGHTIAFGRWQGDFPCLASRWDGEGDSIGYPIGRRGRPKWYAIPNDLIVPFLTALLAAAPALPGTDPGAIVAALNEVTGSSP